MYEILWLPLNWFKYYYICNIKREFKPQRYYLIQIALCMEFYRDLFWDQFCNINNLNDHLRVANLIKYVGDT